MSDFQETAIRDALAKWDDAIKAMDAAAAVKVADSALERIEDMRKTWEQRREFARKAGGEGS